MDENRNLIIVPAVHNPHNREEHIYHEIINYLDDRCWPVSVWQHNQAPDWLRSSLWGANVWYLLRLLWAPSATLLIDYHLYPFLSLALCCLRKSMLPEVLVYVDLDYEEATAGLGSWARKLLWKWGLKRADVIVASSDLLRQKLIASGLEHKPILVLDPLQTFLPLAFQQSEEHETEVDFSFGDPEFTGVLLPHNLTEALACLAGNEPLPAAPVVEKSHNYESFFIQAE